VSISLRVSPGSGFFGPTRDCEGAVRALRSFSYRFRNDTSTGVDRAGSCSQVKGPIGAGGKTAHNLARGVRGAFPGGPADHTRLPDRPPQRRARNTDRAEVRSRRRQRGISKSQPEAHTLIVSSPADARPPSAHRDRAVLELTFGQKY